MTHMIYDDVFDFAFRQHLYAFFVKSSYFLGWNDRDDAIPASYKYLHSMYSQEDVDNCGFFNNIKNLDLIETLEDKTLTRSVVNLSHPCNVYFPHSHPNQYALIYYANIAWNPHWHGETIIYKENGIDIETCVSYIPNRVLLLDKGVPHAIRPQSIACPEYRITFASFFEDQQ